MCLCVCLCVFDLCRGMRRTSSPAKETGWTSNALRHGRASRASTRRSAVRQRWGQSSSRSWPSTPHPLARSSLSSPHSAPPQARPRCHPRPRTQCRPVPWTSLKQTAAVNPQALMLWKSRRVRVNLPLWRWGSQATYPPPPSLGRVLPLPQRGLVLVPSQACVLSLSASLSQTVSLALPTVQMFVTNKTCRPKRLHKKYAVADFLYICITVTIFHSIFHEWHHYHGIMYVCFGINAIFLYVHVLKINIVCVLACVCMCVCIWVCVGGVSVIVCLCVYY